MVQHQLNGHEFEQALGHGEGQESLAWCSPWGHKELDMTELLKKNTVKGFSIVNEAETDFFWNMLVHTPNTFNNLVHFFS